MSVAEVMARYRDWIQRVLLTMYERERTRLIQPTGIRLPNHARRQADGLCDGMACDTQENCNG